MISFLRGTIVRKSPSEIVVDVNGVGYAVSIPLSTYEQLPDRGEATILTWLHVREDLLQLCGFATESEREMFRHLIGVNGIGPKMALAILSGLSTAGLREAIAAGDEAALTAAPGVGKKLAARMIMDLREKIGKAPAAAPAGTGSAGTGQQMRLRTEAVVALMALGHSRAAAEQALRRVVADSPDLPVEELIRRALNLARAG